MFFTNLSHLLVEFTMAPEGTESVEFEIIHAKFKDKSEWKPAE